MFSGSVAAFVHAKADSERLPGKNLADLGGRPLFAHAVIAALDVPAIDSVIVDSDSEEILGIAKGLGAETLRRPAELATNDTTGDDLARWQLSNAVDAEWIVQVVPTSPFLRPETIEDAIEMARITGVDSVFGVRSDRLYLWQNGRPAYTGLPNSDSLPEVTWETTGLYVMRSDWLRVGGVRVNPASCRGIRLSAAEAIDINSMADLEFARIVHRGQP